MSKKRISLTCYSKLRVPSTHVLLLPGLLRTCLFCYTGLKFERLAISSVFMLFLSVHSFMTSKKIGRIHVKKNDRNKKKKR